MPSQGYDRVAIAKARAARDNEKPGTLTGYDCPLCLNRGHISVVDENGVDYLEFCECRKVRGAMRNIEKSGLAHLLDTWTFDNFQTGEGWQRSMADKAIAYADAVRNGAHDWFFIGGQPGAGKTHLCTAICGLLLRAGVAVRYLEWVDAVEKIKACRYDPEAIDELLEPLKRVDVLYLDDLFKNPYRAKPDRYGNLIAPKPQPTDADVRACYEILNARYIRRLPTIISCEWMLLDDLMGVDEASFSRVYEMSRAFITEIGRDVARNKRLGRGGP